ncbi:FAD-dependent monooxygenase [Edaphobacter sp. HDX4]|uniref:NAD(P)/FAD-dependent oxidoreductase n=1 Tax=Edaphobacter sp. HDX4 TaxID=2794064 RepID=UPI002FE65E0D
MSRTTVCALSPKQNNTDVAIIGGGPAGLAAAIALQKKGIECTVVEALEPPIDKGCGEGLMPDALHSLKELGIEITEEEGYPFQGIRFATSADRVDAEFPNGTGIGVRRTHLHQRMSHRAREVGVTLAWRSHATLSSGGRLLINGAEMRYRWLIGADGTASQVRKWAGLDEERFYSQRFGFRRHYQIAPWGKYVEVHWGRLVSYTSPLSRVTACASY